MTQIDELRQIIVGDSGEQLAKLRDRIENVESRTLDVSEVLPPAIDAGIKQDSRLVESFKKPVAESMKAAIRSEPAEYAEILYPVMGPAIRRAIAQAMSSLMITINQSLESATSVKGMGLRFKAMVSGMSYAQLALRQSLQYKVEHVYLIDRDSGIMLAELEGEGTSSLDSDAVSAMFSAIQSFVQDSFSQNEDDRLTDFKVGEYKVWLAHGPNAMLACVIFGEAPQRLKFQLHDTLDRIRTDYSTELSTFSGDSSNFIGIEERFMPLLQSRLRDEDSIVDDSSANKSSFMKRFMIFCLIAVFAIYVFNLISKNSKLGITEYYLKDLPGLVTTDIFWEDNKIIIKGLLDPQVKIPYSVLALSGIDEEMLELKTVSFRSLDPTIEIQRFIIEFAAPDGVNFSIEGDSLTLQGYAPIEWLISHSKRFRQLSATDRLNVSGLYVSASSARSYFEAIFDEESGVQDLDKKIIEITSIPWIQLSSDVL